MKWTPRPSAAAVLMAGAAVGLVLAAGAAAGADALTADDAIRADRDRLASAALERDRADALRAQLRRERAAAGRTEAGLRRDLRTARRAALHTPTVAEALTIASVVHGVSRSRLSAVALCESGHRPAARNGQYVGIFQWGPSWASTTYAKAGLSPWSPYAAALGAAERASAHGWGWWPECGRRGAR